MPINKLLRKNVHVHSAGVGEKEADNFTPAHGKKHNNGSVMICGLGATSIQLD